VNVNGTTNTVAVRGQRDIPARWLDNEVGPVLSAQPGREEGLTMSERASAPGSPGDEPNDEPGALDDAREAALMREVLREQEQHREGGVEPGLEEPDAPTGSNA
jgi:hypothetical protein